MQAAEQLLLNLQPRTDARLTDFAGAAYAPVVRAARELLTQPGSLLFLHGEPGQGRSHLLSALCSEAEAQGLGAVLLPLQELVDSEPDLLAGLESQALIALDDLEAVAGRADWEESLFHLFNRARLQGVRMVFSARDTAARLGLQLPDLVSRLAQAPAWLLDVPDDESRQALLEAAALRRGLVLEPEVTRYLVQRAPREPGRLLALLERLDRHSLAAGRRLTIPFVRQWLDGADDPAPLLP